MIFIRNSGRRSRPSRSNLSAHSSTKTSSASTFLSYFRVEVHPVLESSRVCACIARPEQGIEDDLSGSSQSSIRQPLPVWDSFEIGLTRPVVWRWPTGRARREEMMARSKKMPLVGGLTDGMAHEINHLLAGVMQTVDVLASRPCSGAAFIIRPRPATGRKT